MKPNNRRFKLLHLQATANFGGDETNSLLLCQKLPEMDHVIAVYFGAGPMEQVWKEAGAPVKRLDLTPANRQGFRTSIRSIVEETEPDAIFVSSVILFPLILAGIGPFRGKVLCHTGNPWSAPFSARLKFWLARWWLRPTAQVTMVHCSHYVMRSYSREPFFKSYRHEVAVSAGAAANLSGAYQPHRPREISGNTPVTMGMLARLDRIKNHRLVIQAFSLILKDYPMAKLEFIGDGSEMDSLKQLAGELGVSEKVIFRGKLPDPFPVARQWDLFLYATTPSEGFGAALAEALSLGLPCLVTDVGPMREVGGEDDSVRYVPADSVAEFAKAAVELLGNQATRSRMSDLSRKRALSEFDAGRFALRITECLQN